MTGHVGWNPRNGNDTMSRLAECVLALILISSWIAGVVIAKGFWSTLFSIYIPPCAWYLFMEQAMLKWFI